jgi:hypothetical protein
VVQTFNKNPRPSRQVGFYEVEDVFPEFCQDDVRDSANGENASIMADMPVMSLAFVVTPSCDSLYGCQTCATLDILESCFKLAGQTGLRDKAR